MVIAMLMTVVVIMVVAMGLSHVRRMGISDSSALLGWRFEMLLQPGDNLVQPDALFEVGKDEWASATHAPCVAVHHF